MPLPLGHAAIGLAVSELSANKQTATSRLAYLTFIIVLANLPDGDVIAGLLFEDNAYAFHRGPTHSLFFTVMMGYAACRCSRLFTWIPRVRFGLCFSLIMSHVMADLFFTSSPVSFFWPFAVTWSIGSGNLTDVLSTVIFDNLQDLWIIAGCMIVILVVRWIRRMSIIPMCFSSRMKA